LKPNEKKTLSEKKEGGIKVFRGDRTRNISEVPNSAQKDNFMNNTLGGFGKEEKENSPKKKVFQKNYSSNNIFNPTIGSSTNDSKILKKKIYPNSKDNISSFIKYSVPSNSDVIILIIYTIN
jgi:hypothetical protein